MSNMSLGEVLKAVKLRGPSFEYGQEPMTYSPEQVAESRKGLFSPSERFDSQEARVSWKGFSTPHPLRQTSSHHWPVRTLWGDVRTWQQSLQNKERSKKSQHLATDMFFLVPGSSEY